jgi:hypothetical protein
MNAPTMSTNVLAAEKLRASGITNGKKLAKHIKSPAVIYFLVKDEHGKDSPRAELHHTEGGEEKVVIYRPHGGTRRTLSAMRKQTLADAIEGAREYLGLEDWRRTPFGNCWLPVAAINRMREELGVDLLSTEPPV